jgi:NitT/TauT family transport system substrate-binding protein
VIVARSGIDTVKDLAGKRIAFARGTPSHTFLLWLLDSGGLNMASIQPVAVSDAIQAAETFKSGGVDAAVVWSPDDDAAVKAVPGSKRLISTKKASHIIADAFFAKEEFLRKYPREVQALVAGWMIGAAEINTNSRARDRAIDILAVGLNQPRDFTENAINNVRLTTYGDNVQFFGNSGATGEDLYTRMTRVYQRQGLAAGAPGWRVISDPTFINSISLAGSPHYAESLAFEAPTEEEIKNPVVIASKPVSIHFPSGSSTISAEAQGIILQEVVPMLRGAGKARIRIEGNTDDVGNRQNNVSLSQKRAEAVQQYLVKNYEFDSNKFIVAGNGPDKPLLSNATAVGRAANRRTDIVVQE